MVPLGGGGVRADGCGPQSAAREYDARRKQRPVGGGGGGEAAAAAVFGARIEDVEAVDGVPVAFAQFVAAVDARGLETEGIFRRAAGAGTVKQLKAAYNARQPVDLEAEYPDPYLAAVLLKAFLRELAEPVVPFALYEAAASVPGIEDPEARLVALRAVLDGLDERRVAVLRALCGLADRVVARSEVNKMTVQNLAIVLGPNLMWPQGDAYGFDSVAHANGFATLLFQHHGALTADEPP